MRSQAELGKENGKLLRRVPFQRRGFYSGFEEREYRLGRHLRIGRRARIGAQAGVMADVPVGADVVGSPAQPVKEFFRHVAILRRLVREATRKRSKDGTSGTETDTD